MISIARVALLSFTVGGGSTNATVTPALHTTSVVHRAVTVTGSATVNLTKYNSTTTHRAVGINGPPASGITLQGNTRKMRR